MYHYKTKWICGKCGSRINKEGVFIEEKDCFLFERLIKCKCGNTKNLCLKEIEIIKDQPKERVLVNDFYYMKQRKTINHYVRC